MRALSSLSIAAGTNQDVTLDSGTIGMLIANESPLAIAVTIAGYSQWLPAWTVNYFKVPSMVSASGKITLAPVSVTSTVNPPSSVVLVTMYTQGDTVDGVYPCALTRQVSGNVTSFQAQELLGVSNTTAIYPDDETHAGVALLTPVQVPNAGGALDMGMVARTAAGASLEMCHTDGANNLMHMDAPLALEINTGMHVKGMQIVSGVGPQTNVAHALGIPPQGIFISCTNGNSANNPVSTALWTSTTFNVYCAAGTDWYALVIG